MPRISEFYGIVVEMFYADHVPPHFHARYGGEEATIVIATGEVLAVNCPAERSDWCENGDAHRSELESNWERAQT